MIEALIDGEWRGAVMADLARTAESPAQRQAYPEHQIQRLYPDCTVTITISPAPGSPGPAAKPVPGPPGQDLPSPSGRAPVFVST